MSHRYSLFLSKIQVIYSSRRRFTLASVEFSGDFTPGISPASVEIAKGRVVALFFSIISAPSCEFVAVPAAPSPSRSSFSLAFLFPSPAVSSFSSFPLSSVNSGSIVVHSGDEIVVPSVLNGFSVVIVVTIVVRSANVCVEHVAQESVVESASFVDAGVDSNAADSVLLDNWRERGQIIVNGD